MHAWLGGWLLAKSRLWVPAVVKDNEQGLYTMALGNGQVLIDMRLVCLGLVLPYHAAQIHAHEVEAQLLCPTQFAVNGGSIEGRGLPHFNLIDGGTGLEVTSSTIGVRLVPRLGFLFGPRLIIHA